ncbi:MAG TPA: hypothetical protein VF764_13305 [Steroidobacteraceae bacterium]
MRRRHGGGSAAGKGGKGDGVGIGHRVPHQMFKRGARRGRGRR